MISDRLTDEQLAEILSGVVDGMEPTSQELAMATELQELRKQNELQRGELLKTHIKELSGPVVPDEIEPDSNNTYDYVDGWNACRAAMFQSKYRDLSQPTDPQVAEYEKIMLQACNSPENSDG
ncbi:TPA: hypothetical protein ACW45H_000365 [Salmonella enterica subsp. enterica serovar Newport]|nr:hypothetical protein [Salmonella enterica]